MCAKRDSNEEGEISQEDLMEGEPSSPLMKERESDLISCMRLGVEERE